MFAQIKHLYSSHIICNNKRIRESVISRARLKDSPDEVTLMRPSEDFRHPAQGLII